MPGWAAGGCAALQPQVWIEQQHTPPKLAWKPKSTMTKADRKCKPDDVLTATTASDEWSAVNRGGLACRQV